MCANCLKWLMLVGIHAIFLGTSGGDADKVSGSGGGGNSERGMPWRQLLDRTGVGEVDLLLEGVLPRGTGMVQSVAVGGQN